MDSDQIVYTVCYVCNQFVRPDHVCKEAEKLNANPKDSLPWIHGDALPSRRYGNVTL